MEVLRSRTAVTVNVNCVSELNTLLSEKKIVFDMAHFCADLAWS